MKVWIVKWVSPFWGYALTKQFSTRKDAEAFKTNLLLNERIHAKIEIIKI